MTLRVMVITLVLRVIGHLSTSFLWLHWVAFMLITLWWGKLRHWIYHNVKDETWSQYSSVSKRKVQLNLGTPLHRISCGILFLTWKWEWNFQLKIKSQQAIIWFCCWQYPDNDPVLPLWSLKRLSTTRLPWLAWLPSWIPINHPHCIHRDKNPQLMVYTNCINFENNENYNKKNKEFMKSTLLSQVGRDWDRWRSRAHKHNLVFLWSLRRLWLMMILNIMMNTSSKMEHYRPQ